MASVIVKNSNIENAIRLLRRRVESTGILRELKRHEFFVKPSEAARAKQRAAIRRVRRKEKAIAQRDSIGSRATRPKSVV